MTYFSLLMINDLIVTFFFSGKSKYCPGTIGSLCSFVLVPIFLFSKIYFYFTLFLISFVGTYHADVFSKRSKDKDPKEVVIDEVLGQMLSFLSIFYINRYFGYSSILFDCFISFILFRLFDIFKPFPINIFDKNIKGGIGIMLDDVIASFFVGFFYFFILAIIQYYFI